MDDFVPSYEKIVQSGNLIEVYQYAKLPNPPRHKKRSKRRHERLPFKSERHVKRAVFNFRRKVRSTLVLGAPHLVTLTILEITSIAVAYKLFTQFGVRLRKLYGKEIIWLTVPEFQKRGAVHFHSLIWNLSHDIHVTEKDSRGIQNLWGYGYVDIIPTDGSPALSGYLAKYMSKAMHDDRLVGKKAYSCSRNALSPVSLNTKTSVALFKEEFSIDTSENPLQPTSEREYTTKWLGKARYRSYESEIEKPK